MDVLVAVTLPRMVRQMCVYITDLQKVKVHGISEMSTMSRHQISGVVVSHASND